ncbi:UNVERIFIED_CONTAM: Kirola [Sesamum latifolium]|uniref:Kirola n=1 Tax=Sesamum latifolium TaxID=2727402 RepID=A0AAW2WYS6_9LAMI
MALYGMLVSRTSIKSDGDLFFELFRYKLPHIANICPEMIQSVDLVAGQWGAVGSVIRWNYSIGAYVRASTCILNFTCK